MGTLGLTISEEKQVAAMYQKTGFNGKRKYTQEELANHFHVAPITIRRALAEQGLVKLVGYKTRRETKLLEMLADEDIHTPQQLEDLINYAASC
ncbi:MAG: hypothetical protein KIG60_01110 [Caryophanon sp.]|nr:hypothetical protein [Caryophanon sp.]